MTLDMSRKLDGIRDLQAVVDEAVAHGDAVENHYLEIKSDVDPTTKIGAVKIAKFILGAANRLPLNSASHFAGHAYLALGVAEGAAVGIAPFDIKSLEDRLRKYLDPDSPPQWDLQMLPVEAGRFVYFISVAPPKDGDPIQICQGEFQDAGKSLLEDGRIYYREKGSTRAAKSGEVKALIRRSKSAAPVDFQVEVVGGAARRYAADTRNTLKKLIAVRAEKISEGWHGNSESLDERLGSLRERAEVEWTGNLDKLASAAWPGVCFELDNTADTYLKNIAVTLTFPQGVEGLDKNDADSITITDLVPSLYKTPDLFGLRSPMDIDRLNLHRASPPSPLSWNNDDGALTVLIEGMDLRPETPWTNDDDDWVIVVRDSSGDSVTAEWHLTAEGHDRAYSGTVEIPIVNASVVEDLRATIWRDASSSATSE